MIFAMLKQHGSVLTYETNSINPTVDEKYTVMMRAVVPQTGYFSAALQLLFDNDRVFAASVLESSGVLDKIDSKEKKIFSDYIELACDKSILFQIPADVTTISDKLYETITKFETKINHNFNPDGCEYEKKDLNHDLFLDLYQKILYDITLNNANYTYVMITYDIFDSPFIVKPEHKPSITVSYELISIDVENESILSTDKIYTVELSHDYNAYEHLIFNSLKIDKEIRTSYNIIYSIHCPSPILQVERTDYNQSSNIVDTKVLISVIEQYYIEKFYIDDNENYMYILKNRYGMNTENHNCSSDVCRVNHSDIEKSLFDKSSEHVEIQYDGLDDFVKQIDDAPTKFMKLVKLYKNNQILASLVMSSSTDEIVGYSDDSPNKYTIIDENDEEITKKVPDDFTYLIEHICHYEVMDTIEI